MSSFGDFRLRDSIQTGYLNTRMFRQLMKTAVVNKALPIFFMPHAGRVKDRGGQEYKQWLHVPGNSVSKKCLVLLLRNSKVNCATHPPYQGYHVWLQTPLTLDSCTLATGHEISRAVSPVNDGTTWRFCLRWRVLSWWLKDQQVVCVVSLVELYKSWLNGPPLIPFYVL